MLAAQGFVSLQFVQLCLCCNVQDEPFLARILISLTFVWSQSVLNSKIRICSDRNEEFMFFFFFSPCVFIPDPGIQQACTFFSAVQTSDKGKKNPL